MIDDKDITPSCCGSSMEMLDAKTTDEYSEKHVPEIEQIGKRVKVNVGAISHPMISEHKIEWVALETNDGFHVSYLRTGGNPIAYFALAEGENIIAAYAYCNVHGLWMSSDVDSGDVSCKACNIQ